MKRCKLIFLVITGTFLLLHLNCSDQPLQFEEDNLPFKNLISTAEQTDALVDSSIVFWVEKNRSQSPNVILGEFEGQRNSILLKFSDLPENVTVQSAVLQLAPSFIFGDPGKPFTGTVHEITSDSSDWNVATIPKITYDPVALTSFQVDSDTEELDEVDLPVSVVQGWVDADIDTLPNYGIFLTFDEADFAKQYDALDGIVLNLTVAQNEVDSIVVDPSPLSTEETYIVEGPKELSPEFSISNFGIHRIVMRFNLDEIPERSVVNFAELVMTLDTENSNLGINTPYGFQFTKIDSIIVSDTGQRPGLILSLVGLASANLKTSITVPELRVNLTTLVQNWVSVKSENKGLLLTSDTEGFDLSRFTFFFDPEDILARPHLEIHYTRLNPF